MNGRGNQYVEARRIVELLKCVINQSRIAENRPINWEQLFRMAEYHQVANILYYALLRMRQEVPKEWRDQFLQRYRRAVMESEQYKNVAEAVFWNCEEEGIHILALDDYILRDYYPMPEMRAIHRLSFWVEKDCRPEVDGMMHTMDFVPVVGEYSYERNGLSLHFVEDLPFATKKMLKKGGGSLRFLPRARNGRYVHEYREPGLFIFLMCCKAQKFAIGVFDIRDLLDIWLFYRSRERGKDWPGIIRKLKKMRLWNFTDHMLTLAGSWFGGASIDQEEELFGELEAFIFTKGGAGKSAAEEILPLYRMMVKMKVTDAPDDEKTARRFLIFPRR